MPPRTPSFIVVGLVLVMFLLGFFYMSCSSTTAELRQTLGDFEDRIRMLTMKNSDHEKEIETINTSKHELEEEKLNIQKQMAKKDEEINDLNTKFNEKNVEFKSLQTDKQVLEEQLKEFKNMSDLLVLKNSAMEKVQQEYHEQKRSNEDLKQQIENYKQQPNQPQEKLPLIPNQRFQPLFSSNETIENSLSLTNLANKIANHADIHQRHQRSANDSLSANKLLIETDNENAQKTVNLTSNLPLNETNRVNNQAQVPVDIQDNHVQLQMDRNDVKQNNQGELNINK